MGLTALGACSENFLDTEDLTEKIVDNYYTTPSEAYEALVGCYDGLQRVWSNQALPIVSETLSDNCFSGLAYSDGKNYQVLDQFDQSKSTADVNILEGMWGDYYKAILRCNTLLEKIEGVNWKGAEEKKPLYIAEARYIRAFCYFDLVKTFGDVPLILNIADANKNLPRTDAKLVYKAIAEDLNFSIANGFAKPYTSMSDEEKGHATKWAAEALLARVYLFYSGYYGSATIESTTPVTKATALTAVEDVITNGGFDLVKNFYSLWPASASAFAASKGIKPSESTVWNVDSLYAGENNKETVFAIKYTYTGDWNGNLDGNTWLVMNGVREQNIPKYGYGQGWGCNTVVPDLYKAFEKGDKRKTASIIGINEELISFVNKPKQREYTGYFLKKYTPACDSTSKGIAELPGHGIKSFMISQFQDYVSIRYADVLLMAAELGSPNQQIYLDKVRERAGLPSKAYSVEVLREERRFEFVGEGIRYWDLLRYGLDYAAQKIAVTDYPVLSGNNQDHVTISASNFQTKKGLLQIPNNQITLSAGVLKQNPGW